MDEFWDGYGEISGQGYARTPSDKCPDFIPLYISDPGAITLDCSGFRFEWWKKNADED